MGEKAECALLIYGLIYFIRLYFIVCRMQSNLIIIVECSNSPAVISSVCFVIYG